MGWLDARQHLLVHGLILTGLTLPAYAKATAIIAIERVLPEVERDRTRFDRDPSPYHASAFGTPGGQEP